MPNNEPDNVQGESEPSTQENIITAKHQTDGMSHFRRSISEFELSEDAESIVLSSWRQGTIQQYEVYTTKWIQYSSARNIDPYSPTVGNVINFLTALFNEGLGYSAINTARSALSAFIQVDGQSIGHHPLVKRFVKGVFQRRPALPRNTVIWDPKDVLDYLEHLDDSSLKQLTFKTVCLLALLTGQRAQSLHLLDINNMSVTDHYVKLRFGDVLKQTRPGYHQSEITLEKFPSNIKLCVVTTVKKYLQKTASVRKNKTCLLLSYQRPFKGVSKATISRWIKVTLQAAGVNMSIFTPHSTRAASTSAALRAHVPLNTILKTAGWNNSCTFAKFYSKPLQTENGICNIKTGTNLL